VAGVRPARWALPKPLPLGCPKSEGAVTLLPAGHGGWQVDPLLPRAGPVQPWVPPRRRCQPSSRGDGGAPAPLPSLQTRRRLPLCSPQHRRGEAAGRGEASRNRSGRQRNQSGCQAASQPRCCLEEGHGLFAWPWGVLRRRSCALRWPRGWRTRWCRRKAERCDGEAHLGGPLPPCFPVMEPSPRVWAGLGDFRWFLPLILFFPVTIPPFLKVSVPLDWSWFSPGGGRKVCNCVCPALGIKIYQIQNLKSEAQMQYLGSWGWLLQGITWQMRDYLVLSFLLQVVSFLSLIFGT